MKAQAVVACAAAKADLSVVEIAVLHLGKMVGGAESVQDIDRGPIEHVRS